jgi:transcriptional regulator with XRE-family HTH domain
LTKPPSDQDKRLLVLRYQCRWPLRRIAAVMGLSISQVSRRLAKLVPKPAVEPLRRIRFEKPISLSRVRLP